MAPLVTLAPDEQSIWMPTWLVTIDPTGWNRTYASLGDLDTLPGGYAGQIVGEPEIERGMTDLYWGPLTQFEGALELSNASGTGTEGDLLADFLAGYEGRMMVIRRYDVLSGFLLTELTAIIARVTLSRTRVRLDFTAFDGAIFQQQLPTVKVTTALFPQALAAEVGKVIPVVFGNVPQMPLLYVCDDKPLSIFYYLVAHGTVGITGAYRNGPNATLYPMVFSEFKRAAGGSATSWAEVARTDVVGGYTVVVPILRQSDFNGGLHTLFADVTGFAAERNFARAIRTIMSNATWGLGKAVNTASYAAAEALLHANLTCDGAMLEQRQAQDWLSQLCMTRGIRLGLNTAGESTITVDTPATTRFMLAQDGTADGERTLLDISGRGWPALDDRVKTLQIKYQRDYSGLVTRGDQEYRHEQTRVVNATAGRDKPYEHNFLRSHEAADRVADYLGKRLVYGQESVDVVLTQEARQLAEGSIVALLDPSMGYLTATDLEVRRLRKGLTRIDATLQGWNEAIYTYTSSTLPADPVAGSESENARTAPGTPTTPTISASGTRVAGDGHVTAWVTLAWSNPTTNFSTARVRYRVNSTTPWLVVALNTTPGATTATVEGLLPATSYDYSLQAVNAPGTLTADSAALLNQLSPTDASVPSAPTGTAVQQQSGTKVVEIAFFGAAGIPPVDWGTTRLYRATVNNTASAVEIQHGKQMVFHDDNVAFGTTYYYWGKIEDASGNLSAFSPSASHAITIVQIQSGDVGDNQIPTPKLPTNTVTASVFDSVSGSQGTTSTSFVNFSGSAATINVSSSTSVILVLVRAELAVRQDGLANGIAGGEVVFEVGGVNIAGAKGQMYLPQSVTGTFPAVITHLDGPGRLGSTTYQVRFRCSAGASPDVTVFNPAIQVTEFKR